jgi:hypothetical protein
MDPSHSVITGAAMMAAATVTGTVTATSESESSLITNAEWFHFFQSPGRQQRQPRRGSGCCPRWHCSSCSPAGGEEPAAAPAVAESAPSQARKAGGRGGKKTKG